MKTIAFSLIILITSGCLAGNRGGVAQGWTCTEDVLATGFPGLPKDATALANRLASCSHFAGEYGGTPERNAEVSDALKELRCDTVETETAAIRSKYAHNKAVLDALVCASQL